MDSSLDSDKRSSSPVSPENGKERSRIDLPSIEIDVSSGETTKYLVDSVNSAKDRVKNITEEAARRSGMALRQLDNLSPEALRHKTGASAGDIPANVVGDRRKLKEAVLRLCEAEKNLMIERDRYGRLLSRHAELSQNQAENIRKVEALESAVSEYQQLNSTLSGQLERQGEMLERIATTITEVRSNEETPARNWSHQLVWSRNQLVVAVDEATRLLHQFVPINEDNRPMHQAVVCTDDDAMSATLPLAEARIAF